jgi:hypothetical protein
MNTQIDPYVWNENVDELIRLLRQMQAPGVLPAHEAVRLAVRLEVLRTRANAGFAELMALREQANALRPGQQQRPSTN